MTWRPTARLFWERVVDGVRRGPHAIAATHYPAKLLSRPRRRRRGTVVSRRRHRRDREESSLEVLRTMFVYYCCLSSFPASSMASSRDTQTFAVVSSGARFK